MEEGTSTYFHSKAGVDIWKLDASANKKIENHTWNTWNQLAVAH